MYTDAQKLNILSWQVRKVGYFLVRRIYCFY